MKSIEAQRQFGRHIGSNVRYWMGRTQDLHHLDLAELDEDRQNLFRAVQFGMALSETWLATVQLILQSWLFIERRGYWREWIPFLSEAVDQCGEAEQALKCRLLNRLGQSQRLDRQWAAAIASHQKAHGIASDIEDEILAARSSYYMSEAYTQMRAFADAERHGVDALERFTRIAPGSIYMATTLNVLGQIARWRGDFSAAEERYGEAIACWRKLDNDGDLATTLLNLAETLQSVDRFVEALAHYGEALPLLTAAGSELRKILAQTNLGSLYYRMGEYVQAEAVFREIDIAYLRQTGDVHFQAVVANGLGNVLLKQGRLEAAESYLRQSRELWLLLDDEINRANTVGTLAEVLTAKGEILEAVVLYDEACELLTAYPDHVWARRLLGEFSQAREALA